jgi:signal transduction histidine kinase
MADEKTFDVFLSYNKNDQWVADMVEVLARRLEDQFSLRPFFNKWQLIPGDPWQEGLEQALNNSYTCAAFIGPGGMAPWHNEEIRLALDDCVQQDDFRVIPVLLPGSTLPERGQVPRFLSRLTWVDFRDYGLDDAEALHKLVAGIRGIPPGRYDRRTPTLSTLECPYRGLEVFDEAHARFFFGREGAVQHLVEALRTRCSLAVVGASGSGKSSLVRAGLIPQLRAGALPGSSTWRYLVMKPGLQPLIELATTLVPAKAYVDRRTDIREVLARLRRDERTLHWYIRSSLHDQSDEMRFCIIVDQLEELFTLCDDEAERERFVDNLRYAATAGGQTVIVLTMRADFMAQAIAYTPLAELLSSHQFLVSPMDTEDLRRAIEEPARIVGLRLEEGLTEMILADVGREPGSLPFMEYALRQLWEQLRDDNVMRRHTYRDIGGVQGALAQRAEEVFAAFTAEQQHIIHRILLRLTRSSEGTEDTRQRARLSELQTRAEEKRVVEHIVNKLADARLLVTTDDQQVDIAHEALIRGWPRLREWIEENRTALRIHRRIGEAAREWHHLKRDEGVLLRGLLLTQAQEWRQQHAEDLNELEDAFLNASTERAQEAQRAERFAILGRLAGALTHEIRNPLAAIFLHADVLDDELKHPTGGDRAQISRSLAAIKEEVSGLHDLVQQYLSLARLSDLRREPMELGAYLEAFARETRDRLATRNITLRLDRDASVAFVALHQNSFRHMLLNLLNNAVEAMPQGGQFTLRLHMEGDQALLEVSDTGCGIPPEQVPLLFSPFHSTKPDGTGLGLYLVREILMAHQGDIAVNSIEGQGTTITLTLPRQAIPSAAATTEQ